MSDTKPITREYHVLNLGAGVQSTYLYLLFAKGEIKDENGDPVVLDCAIFADTGEEPKPVYDHLQWLQDQDGPEIWVRQKGVLGDDIMQGENSTGQRFASVPFFALEKGKDSPGMTRRQCSMEYKIDPIIKAIRYDLVGLKPRQWMPKDVRVHQYIGMSFDECRRALRVKRNFLKNTPWSTPHFPLIDMKIARSEIKVALKDLVPHETPRSACTFCPFHSNAEWRNVRDTDPEGWKRAVMIDHRIREEGCIVNRNMAAKMYCHRSCVPLDEADIDTDPAPREELFHPEFGFINECQGMCGL